jgi:hypothetical protein
MAWVTDIYDCMFCHIFTYLITYIYRLLILWIGTEQYDIENCVVSLIILTFPSIEVISHFLQQKIAVNYGMIDLTTFIPGVMGVIVLL